jgi:hypothetical protein
MKCYFLWTVTGPMLILTSFDYVAHPDLLEKLRNNGIPKFVAYEVPIDLIRERYGGHFKKVMDDLSQTDELRILDIEGERVLHNVRLKELGSPIIYE